MPCIRIPNGILCVAGPIHELTDANGKVWHFEYHWLFGPTVVRKDGEFAKRQPTEGSPFWPAFSAWHAKYIKDGGYDGP